MKINFLSKIKEFYDFKKISNSNKYKKIIDLINNLNINEKNNKKFKKNSKSLSEIKKLKNLKFSGKLKSGISELKKKFSFPKIDLTRQKNKSQSDFLFLKNLINSEKFKIIFDQIKKYEVFTKKSSANNIKKSDKYNQKIGVIFYCDHKLVFVSLIINLKNQINILGVTEIPIPGNVIGDFIVEDKNELANVALDSVNLLGLNDSPLLVILSSSFFTIHTFSASDLKQISLTDNKIQSKSPYLPSNTLVDFLRMSDKQISNSLIRTIYCKKDLIKSWTDTLQIIDLPIIGLIPAATHIFDAISLKTNEEKIVLIDIESTTTNLLIGSKLADLTSHKLPYGYSLYLTSDLKTANKDYFSRLKNSVNLIFKETKNKIPLNSYVMGSGVDKLISNECELPDGFTSICELNLSDHYYQPQKMSIHEVISDSIETKIYSLTSILTSCV